MDTNQELKRILKKVKKVEQLIRFSITLVSLPGFSTHKLAKWKNKLKKILGPKLNLNDFTKACNEARGEIGDEPLSDDELPCIITNCSQLREVTAKALEAIVRNNNPP